MIEMKLVNRILVVHLISGRIVEKRVFNWKTVNIRSHTRVRWNSFNISGMSLIYVNIVHDYFK